MTRSLAAASAPAGFIGHLHAFRGFATMPSEQRIYSAIAALVLHYFARYEAHLPNWLYTLGSYAFAIYFLHMFFVMLAGQIPKCHRRVTGRNQVQ